MENFECTEDNLPMITAVTYSALLGITMKLADLTDEHDRHYFKYDDIVLGLLWGLFGVLLVLLRADVANVMLAMVLGFIVRKRIDYRNHMIATVMIIIAYVWKAQFDLVVFTSFFLPFLVFGLLRDYVGDIRKKRDWWYWVNEPMWYYVLPPIVFSVVTGNWLVTVVCISFAVFYDLTKLLNKGF